MNKKAALNLSIQMIVIIVIAMTLLSLALVFVRQQFSQISSIGTEVQEQTREQITAQLRQSGDKVSFPRSQQFNKRGQKVITLGIQNVGSQSAGYRIGLKFDACNSGYDQTTCVDAPNPFDLRWDKGCVELSPADGEVFPINVIAPPTPGTYAINAIVYEYLPTTGKTGLEECEADTGKTGGNKYASKLTFITVS